jgi:hypothetical protein
LPDDTAELVELDRIVAIGYADEGAVIVRKSDLMRPLPDGRHQSAQSVLVREYGAKQAVAQGNAYSDEDVEKRLIQIEKQFRMTRAQIHQMFAEYGYGPDEGRQLLKILQLSQEAEGQFHRAHSAAMMITPADIAEFLANLPYIWLVEAIVPSQHAATAEEARVYAQAHWDELEKKPAYKVAHADLAHDKQFIKNAAEHEIVLCDKEADGYSVTRRAGVDDLEKQAQDETVRSIMMQRQQKLHEEYEAMLLGQLRVRVLVPELVPDLLASLPPAVTAA